MVTLSFFLFAVLSFSPFLNGAEEIILSKEAQELSAVQRQYAYVLAALRKAIGDQQEQKDAIAEEEPQTKPAKKEKLSFGSLTLPAQTQLEMALELMTRLDTPSYNPTNRAQFSPETWQSLRLIDKEPNALSGIAPTMQTMFGKLFLARTITAPIVDIDRIKIRQDAVRELCGNMGETIKITKICRQIAKIQSALIGLTSADHPLYSKGPRIFQHEFFLRGIAPKSRLWNTVSKNFGDIWYGLGIPLFTLALYKAGRGMLKGTGGLKNLKEAAKNPGQSLTNLFTRNKNREKFDIEKATGSDYRTLGLGLAGVAAYAGGVQFPGIYNWMKQRFAVMGYFYQQLMPLRTFFMATTRLKKIFNKLPGLQPLADEIDATIKAAGPDMEQLYKIITGPALRTKAGAKTVLGGDLILAVDLLGKCRDHVLKGIGLVGALDTYTSLARWIIASQFSTETPLCFASFKKGAQQPFIDTQDFWHVLSRGTPILNSIKLGDGAPQNAIITGVFESGKSTVLQGVALNVVCAQSIGICLCRSYKATPFASINIYANIKDDIAAGRSLFKTELYRASQLLEQIKHMPAGTFSFTIADATFTGTEAGAGQAAAYSVARYLGQLPNSIALHATNFLSLNILGKQDPARFANYMLPTNYNGKIVQSYALTPGTQEPHLATAIFKEENLPQPMVKEMDKQLAALGA